jgi:hypothetical protein
MSTIGSHTAAVVFTNRLARQGFCLMLRPGQKTFSKEPFATVASDNYILTSNPLAQRESLALALQKAASLFPPSGASYTLIVKIPWHTLHGTDAALIGHIVAHQEARSRNEGQRWKKIAKASYLNHEIIVLMQVMKRAKLWESHIGQDYRPMELPAFSGPKVLNDLEKRRLFHVASQNPDWQLAYWVQDATPSLSPTLSPPC